MNNDWSSLSMRERAEYIKDAVSRGLHTVDSIRNEYKDGGKKKRTALDIQAANKQIFLKSLELSLKGNSRYSSAGWRKYLTDLALLESGYLAGITNKIGAKGYFLLMPSNRASSWSSPTLLFEEMFKMTDSNIQYLKKNMTKADLAKALALGIDIYGLVAGAHLGGAKGALNALRGVRNSKDMNGTSVMKYMKLFSQSTPKLTEADYQSNYSTSDLNRNRIVMLPHVEPVDNTYVAPIEPRYSINPTLLPQGEAEGIQTSLMSLIMLELESPKMLLVEEPEVESSPLTYILKVSRSSVPVIKTQTPNKVATASDLYKKYYDVSSPTLLLLNLEEAIYRSSNNEFGNGGLKGNLYGGDNPNGQLMMTVGSIGYMPKIYAEKPDAIHVQKPDLPIFVEPDVSNAAALERQRMVYSNYDEALDNPLNPVQKVIYNGLRYLKDNVYEGIPSGVSNCTLTATQWVNPASPIKLASSIVNDPGKYNYSKISKEDALPGNLVIAKVPNLDSYHTMMLSGFADKDSTYTFDGKKYKVTKGEPLVTYSRGGHDNSFIRRNVPLSVYTSNSDGHTENLFYRYNSPNEVFLPDVVVTAKRGNKRALGGNLFGGGSWVREVNNNPIAFDAEGNLVDQITGEKGYMLMPEVEVIANPIDVGRGKARRMFENAFIESNDATATPYTTNSHLNERSIEGATKAAAWMQDNPTLNNAGMALGAVPLAVAGYPAFMAAGEGAATALLNPYVDAALTSGFGAHGLQKLANGEADWTTALEIAPLGGLVRPMFNAGDAALFELLTKHPLIKLPTSKSSKISSETLANLKDTPWYQEVSKEFGESVANLAVQKLQTPGFFEWFYGENPQLALLHMDRFANLRDIINKITGSLDEGKAAMAGSGAGISLGSFNRVGAALHDLDVTAYMNDASKTVNPSEAFIDNLAIWNFDKLSLSPIFQTIRDAYPKTFKNAKVTRTSKLLKALEGLNRWWNNDFKYGKVLPNPFPDSYLEGRFNLTPMFNISDLGANRVAMTRINGEPIDIFLSDRYVPTVENSVSADNVLGWKRAFIDKYEKAGRTPRAKDVNDIENYVPFSEENPVINAEGQSLYAPFSFKKPALIDNLGIPVLAPIETYPGSNRYIPAFMNYRGEMKSLPLGRKK